VRGSLMRIDKSNELLRLISIIKYSVTQHNAPHHNSAGTLPALADLRKNTTHF